MSDDTNRPSTKYSNMQEIGTEVKTESIFGDGTDGIAFTNATGHIIRTRQFIPQGKAPIALLFYFPGFVDHVQMPGFVRMAQEYVRVGIAVFGIDHEGHGVSEGDRALFSFQGILADSTHFINIVRRTYSDVPYFIMGHSMGGAMVVYLSLDASQRNDIYFQGGICLAPMIHQDIDPPRCFITLLKSLIVPCCPAKPCCCIPTPDVALIYTDVKNREECVADKLFIPLPVRLGVAADLVDASYILQQRLHEVSFPFLVCHGDQDKICPIAGSYALFKESRTPASEKSLRVIKGAFHDMLTDECAVEVRQACLEFINARVIASAPVIRQTLENRKSFSKKRDVAPAEPATENRKSLSNKGDVPVAGSAIELSSPDAQ